MGNDLSSSNNDLLKKFSQTIMQDSWLSNMYGTQRADQQAELKKIFSVVSENNITNGQRAALEARKETIQEKVERLEAKMAVLEEELAKNQEEIKKQADAITDLITDVEGKSETLATKQKERVNDAVEDVFFLYKNGKIGKDAITGEIRKRIEQDSRKSRGMAEIEKILGKLDAKQAEVSALVTDATKWIDQRTLLENQYGVTKSTYDLINKTLSQVGATNTKYSNSDYNTKVPVYSLDKTEVVSKYMEDSKINVPAGNNPNYIEGSTPPTVDGIKEKYAQYLGTKATEGVDAYSVKNKAVENLGKAIEDGMLNDLLSAGLGYSQITDFLADNFSAAKISKNENGSLNIPHGHGADAKNIFTSVDEFLKGYNTSFLGTKNTWDAQGGNTISSNASIKSLSENYSKILDEMSGSDPKFTFKEAMFALFNKDTGIFKDSGVVYDLDKQGENPSYFIEFAGDEETAKMYEEMSNKIYDIWGVKPSRGQDATRYGEDVNTDTNPGEENRRIDPVSIRINNTEYAFIIDRNNDGTFTGKKDGTTDEFVGATGNWLEDLKTFDKDGDGKLTGEELKNLRLLGAGYNDNVNTDTSNVAFNPNKTTVEGKNFLRGQTTRVDYTLTNAADLGISEINLNDLEDQVNKSKGVFDINGSEKFSDSFKVQMSDGSTLEAARKDDTAAFMNTIYGDAYGKNYNVGLSEDEIQSTMDKDYGEFDTFSSKYGDIFGDINVLKGVGQAAQEARLKYQETLDRIAQDENLQIIKAGNKAAAESNATNWYTIQSQVASLAAAEGINIDMEQAKGIYVLDGSKSSARDVLEAYKEQMNLEDSITRKESTSKEAWAAIILCAQNGLDYNADKITELLTSGQAKTAQDVVNILKEAQNSGSNVNITVNNLGELNERETEIYEAFHKVFSEAGVHDKTVEALAQLCIEQQNNPSFMVGKDANTLAQEMLKKYQTTK